jgi:hypothetical protein
MLVNFSSNPELMKKQILHQIPIGSSVSEAQKKMEGYGFECVRDNNVPISYSPAVYKDTLYCDKSIGFLLIGKQWKAIFIYENELVKDVITSVNQVYP